ncbi:hypothetical protein ACQ86N_43845 [Puia sp. P3]|uniref:hypothetical protein n=1 Tax=Puia sp. P3 TaxID=3423952 RepID=UPI003D671293
MIFLILNLLYKYNVIDPTNKAYGLFYNTKEDRPLYDRETLLQLCSEENLRKDRANMVSILDRWKARQSEAKPILFLVNTSGGGSRSATFTMNILQRLDSLSNGQLMRKTVLITGASGGMLGAAYFREAGQAARQRRHFYPSPKQALYQRYFPRPAQHPFLFLCRARPGVPRPEIHRRRTRVREGPRVCLRTKTQSEHTRRPQPPAKRYRRR